MNCSVFSASKFIVTNLQLWEIGQSRVFLWIKMRVFGLIQEVGHRSESRNLPSKYCTKMNLEKTYLSIVRLKGHCSSKSYLGDDSPSSICYLLSHTYLLWMSCSLCSCVTVPGISVTIILKIDLPHSCDVSPISFVLAFPCVLIECFFWEMACET